MSFDEFTREPVKPLRNACKALRLPFHEGVLRRTVPGHAVAGNSGSMRRLRDADYGVTVDSLLDPDLPAEHAELICANAEMQATYADLMTMHNKTAEDHVAASAAFGPT